jgi:hypothetical protein
MLLNLDLSENKQARMTRADISALCRAAGDQGQMTNIVRTQVRRSGGRKDRARLAKNSRVNAGAQGMAQNTGSTAGNPFNYVALSPTAITAAATDTALSGETSAAGLARKAATYGNYTAPASLNATATYTLTASWTNTSGSTVTIQSIAMFNASSAGTMLAEALLSTSEVLNNGDTLNLVWTITV